MTDNVLVEHWRKANLDAPPYLHPDDDVPPEDRETDISSYKDFWFKAWREEQSVKGRLHLNLLPQPYLGDLANAKIFILLLNPGCRRHITSWSTRYPVFGIS